MVRRESGGIGILLTRRVGTLPIVRFKAGGYKKEHIIREFFFTRRYQLLLQKGLSMQIAFLGAAQTVTGSQHLLSINGSKILLDCGLYQGSPTEAYKRNKEFDFDPAEIDVVILSHAHIDHSGNIPNLVKNGYQGPIYTTHATAHLADLMLRDSAHIQEAQAEDMNGKQDEHQSEIEALYSPEDAARVARLFRGTCYNTEFEVAPGVTASLIEAGHILGSAAVALDIEEHEKKHRVWFSGDIGRRNLPLIRDPELPSDVDTLIMECTYGDRSHEDPLAALDELRQVLARTIERGGKVIIPAFAVGRTQEIVYDIHQMIERNELPEVPVYVDSPLAVDASQVFTDHPEFFDDETRNFLNTAESRTALGFDVLSYIESVEESIALNDRNEPMIIISASGMAQTGRVVHHIRNNIGDPRTTILIVSYQAPGTLGRALANGDEQVMIYGKPYQRKAEVITIPGLSAHARQGFLTEYGSAVKGRVKQVFLVHGEENAAESLRQNLNDNGIDKVYFPLMRQIMEIE
jgi:metallo-beta-lactamase family protein